VTLRKAAVHIIKANVRIVDISSHTDAELNF